MKTLILPVLALGLASFAMPAMAGDSGCGWGKTQSTEKPVEKPKAQTS